MQPLRMRPTEVPPLPMVSDLQGRRSAMGFQLPSWLGGHPPSPGRRGLSASPPQGLRHLSPLFLPMPPVDGAGPGCDFLLRRETSTYSEEHNCLTASSPSNCRPSVATSKGEYSLACSRSMSRENLEEFTVCTPCTPSLPSCKFHTMYPSVTERDPSHKLQLCIQPAGASRTGRRSHQEDQFSITDDLCAPETTSQHVPTFFAAVFDGHGGSQAATYASHVLHQLVCIAPTFYTDLGTALVDGLRHTDASLLAQSGASGLQCGTTAVAMTIRGLSLTIANLGDSRAVLSTDGHAVPLSHDHKPTDETERSRILKCGGSVDFGRVCGELNVSRGLGDYHLKNPSNLASPECHPMSNVADIATVELSDSSDFVVLATDGLWDVMTPQQVVDYVTLQLRGRQCGGSQPLSVSSSSCLECDDDGMSTPRNDLQRICEHLVQHAVMECGSNDNVTAVIVLLH